MKKVLLLTVLYLTICTGICAQQFLNPPKANERVLGAVVDKADIIVKHKQHAQF